MTPPGARVLIVEDSPEDAEVFRTYLERAPHGFACTVASSGETGLERLRQSEFECVVLDHHLPDLSGLEFLASFTPTTLPCAVVMLTGVGDEALAVAALQAGAEDYLSKSRLNRDGLCLTVQNAIERFDLKRRLERERRRNEAILSSISDAFFAFDRQWHFTYVNSAGERLLERSAATLVGQSLWATFPMPKGTAFETELRRATSHDQSLRFEAEWPGIERWLEVRVYPSKSGISLYAADITDRRRDEERRLLLETVVLEANDAIIITEAEPLDEPGAHSVRQPGVRTAQWLQRCGSARSVTTVLAGTRFGGRRAGKYSRRFESVALGRGGSAQLPQGRHAILGRTLHRTRDERQRVVHALGVRATRHH
jgi:PAS domain S-box-containing protein